MGTMEYRFYESGNKKAIVQLWNECLHHDPNTPGRLRNMVLLDANFDPEGFRLAFEDGRQGAWFLWTGETTTAGLLYKKLGFQITRRFHVCRKSF